MLPFRTTRLCHNVLRSSKPRHKCGVEAEELPQTALISLKNDRTGFSGWQSATAFSHLLTYHYKAGSAHTAGVACLTLDFGLPHFITINIIAMIIMITSIHTMSGLGDAWISRSCRALRLACRVNSSRHADPFHALWLLEP